MRKAHEAGWYRRNYSLSRHCKKQCRGGLFDFLTERKPPARKEGEIMKKTSKTLAILLTVILCAALLGACGSKPSSGKTGKDSTYAYLLDTSSLKKPELDLKNPSGVLKDVLDRGVLRIASMVRSSNCGMSPTN